MMLMRSCQVHQKLVPITSLHMQNLRKKSLFSSCFSSIRLFSTNHIHNHQNHSNNNIQFESGKIGHLAASNTLCTSKGTVVHAVVSIGDKMQDNNNNSSLPLHVDYKLKAYAYGMIPESRNRRESGSVDEMLAARVVDRSLRPLFSSSTNYNEMQITCTVHSLDVECDPIATAVNAASCALMQTKLDWQGPVGCVRVGRVNGMLKVDLTAEERTLSDLDLLYTGTKTRVLMMEVEANQLPELELKEALRFAQVEATKVIQQQLTFLQERESTLSVVADTLSINSAIVDTSNTTPTPPSTDDVVVPTCTLDELYAIADEVGLPHALAFFQTGEPLRIKRRELEGGANSKVASVLECDPRAQGVPKHWINSTVARVMETAFRTAALTGHRPDRRAQNEVRQVTCQPGMLPATVHGSAFFTRGDTHVLCAVTLGHQKSSLQVANSSGRKENENNSLNKHFFLHYDFPPYCTGKVDNATAVNRRMIGHGMLAEKAMRSLIPKFEDFPYTIRVSSECTSSSGSSSMASVCGASLALMDAGVPIKAPAAGVSIGLITKFDETSGDVIEYRLLTDILGTEDHFGDMDFKVAGTSTGVTAIQLDVKLPRGVPLDILCEALDSARDGRAQILSEMKKSLPRHRSKLKPTAPSAQLVKFDPERKRFLLGPGNETINYIQELYSCDIDGTSTPGVAYLFGTDAQLVQQARDLVQDLVVPIKEGDIVQAEVSDVRDFGAFVRVSRAQEALLHASELTHDTSLLKKPLSQLIKIGQRFAVKIMAVDTAAGMVKVSRKLLLDRTAEDNLLTEVEDSSVGTAEASTQLPSFPTTPPRQWSTQFFKHSVVGDK